MFWITGVQGFIGSNLAGFLSKKGFEVGGIGCGSWNSEDASTNGLRYFVCGEITADNLDTLAKEGGLPTTVFHLAGGSSVGPSFAKPRIDFLKSVDSIDCLLDWLRAHSPLTKVVFASSAAVYGAGHQGNISEETPLCPFSPYGWNKALAEMLCKSYVENFGIKISILRLFSVYGGGLQKQLIWDVCGKLRSKSPQIDLCGTGKELRDWIHIDDVVRLLARVSELENKRFIVINGATGVGTCVADIVKLICRHWGSNPTLRFSGEARKGDPQSLVADITCLHQQNFRVEIPINKGLEKTVNWYKKMTGC